MNLVVIRHGETDMNKDERLQGSREPGLSLNEKGRNEVARLRDEILSTPEIIYVSPLLRALETAKIINQRFMAPLSIAPELVERDFGTLSGTLKREVDHDIVESDLEGRYDYRPFGGESVEDVKARILSFLKRLPLMSDRTAFVVTHRGVIRVLYDLYPNQVTPSEVLNASKHVFRITALPV